MVFNKFYDFLLDETLAAVKALALNSLYNFAIKKC